MNKTDLEKILTEHTLWLHNEEGKRADLSEADLRSRPQRSRPDFSVLPLWCGSLGAKVGRKNYGGQIVYHTIRLAQNSEISCDLKGVLFTKGLIEQANLFHRVESEDVERITDESLAYHTRKAGAAEELETMDGKDLGTNGGDPAMTREGIGMSLKI